MPTTPPVDIRFLVTISCSDEGKLDPNGMRKKMRDLLGRAAADGTLLALDDDTSYLGQPVVQFTTSPEDMILAMMSETIHTGLGARQVIEDCVKLLRRDHSRAVRHLLTQADRDHLIKGIAMTRKRYESRSETPWIEDVVQNGYPGWGNAPDELLLADAFLDNSCLGYLENDADRVAVLGILARSDVLEALFPHGASHEVCAELEQELDALVNATDLGSTAAAEAQELSTRIVFAVQALTPEVDRADAPGA